MSAPSPRPPLRPGNLGAGASVDVLLIEDDDGDAFLVEELLLESGAPIEITRVHTLSQARDRLDPDVRCVLLDLGLPDAEGLSALKEMLELAPWAAVLVLTGLADEHRGIAAVAAGAQDYLVKGQVDGELLARAIRYSIERKRADESLRRLYESEVRAEENARLERGLLPQPLLSDPDLACVPGYRPGRYQALLGGDFYDLVETPDGTVYAMIGDVAGHGPDEAALGVCLRIAWRTLVLAGLPAHRILPILDDVLVRERKSEEVFATACMVTVPPSRDTARLYMAGHPVPLLLRGNDVVTLSEVDPGPAMGLLPEFDWVPTDFALGTEPWSILLYTDGLIEGRVGAGAERLGVERLLHLVRASLESDHRHLSDTLIEAVEHLNGGPLEDDVAAMLLSYRSPPA